MITSADIELAIARLFNPRVNMIVPNVSWGLNMHECDLLIVTKARLAIEIEIKTTKADIIRDAMKGHGHYSRKLKCTYFAIPESLKEHAALIPDRFGVITVSDNDIPKCTYLRKAKLNMAAVKITDAEYLHLGRLAAMRIWNLIEANLRLLRYKKGELK